MRPTRRPSRPLAVLALLGPLAVAGCSINKYAVNKLGDALAGSGTTFASDDDPELIAQAVPFSLKLIESLLSESPRHKGLLLAAASGFTQYGYAFVQPLADSLEDVDLGRANAQRLRARRLYFRARDYGLRGLDAAHEGFSTRLRADARAAVRVATVADVPLLYWTAAAWGAGLSVSKDRPDIIADQLLVEALIDRALELDEDYDAGAIHGLLISYEPARQGARGDPYERSRAHFERAVALSDSMLAAPFVSYAEAVGVGRQDWQLFDTMLQRAVAIDADARPEWRLANLVAQRRARWLQSKRGDLFLDAPEPTPRPE